MGNSCARGDNRSEVDSMQPAHAMNSSPPNGSVNIGTEGTDPMGLESSKTSFQSSFEAASSGDILSGGNSSNSLTIDDFHLMKVVGRGSFGKVYMARKKDNNKVFAVKTLKKDFIIRTN